MVAITAQAMAGVNGVAVVGVGDGSLRLFMQPCALIRRHYDFHDRICYGLYFSPERTAVKHSDARRPRDDVIKGGNTNVSFKPPTT